MKVLLVNGSPHPKGCTYTALQEVAGQLEKEGVESVLLQLGTRPVQDCIACGKCAETGLCVFKDDPVNEAIGLLKECDGLVVGSPVYYGGPTGSLCSFLDRLCFRKAAPYAGKPAACVVSCRRGGATAAFERLNQFFGMLNMPIVTSQYWNIVYGAGKGEAKLDKEGMQTMRTLGNNMAWLLEKIHSGGDSAPEREERHEFTNFIR